MPSSEKYILIINIGGSFDFKIWKRRYRGRYIMKLRNQPNERLIKKHIWHLYSF